MHSLLMLFEVIIQLDFFSVLRLLVTFAWMLTLRQTSMCIYVHGRMCVCVCVYVGWWGCADRFIFHPSIHPSAVVDSTPSLSSRSIRIHFAERYIYSKCNQIIKMFLLIESSLLSTGSLYFMEWQHPSDSSSTANGNRSSCM